MVYRNPCQQRPKDEIFYFEKETLSWIKDFSNYAKFLEFLVNERKLKGFVHHGNHLTVNTLHELEEAEKSVKMIEKSWE